MRRRLAGVALPQAISLGGKQHPWNHLAAFFSFVHQEGLLCPSMGPPRVTWLRITSKNLADLRNPTPGLLPTPPKKNLLKKVNLINKCCSVIIHSSFATSEQLEPKEFSEIVQIVIISKKLF